MLRLPYCLCGALILAGVWLGLIIYQNRGDLPACLASLGDSMSRVRLRGLAAKCYLAASTQARMRLQQTGRQTPAGRHWLERIIAYRLAAARVLRDAGQLAAAERVALEAARADYDNPQARAMLLEIRLQGPNASAARRELMRLVWAREEPAFFYLLARSFLAEQRLTEAEAFLQRALAKDPYHTPSLCALADLALARGDLNAARVWRQRAAQTTDPSSLESASAVPLPQNRFSAWRRVYHAAALWWRSHYGSFLFAASYLLFCFSPALGRCLRRRCQGVR